MWLRKLQLPFTQRYILKVIRKPEFPGEKFFEAPAMNHLLGHQFKVNHPRFQPARRYAAFAVLVVGLCNRLLLSDMEAPSLNIFKDNSWDTIFLDCVLYYECIFFVSVHDF